MICASRVAHLARVASATVTDLVLFHLIGGDARISYFDLLLFLRGAGISRFAADVEGISSVSTFSCSSSIRVPPHSGEDSMVNTSVFSSVIIALTSLVSTIAASNATPVSTSAIRAALLFSLFTGFSCTSSPNYST